MNNSVLFEQPLSQSYRHFIKIENYFIQLNELMSTRAQSTHLTTLSTLLHFLEFLNRNDIKSELIKELELLQSYYKELSKNPAVDRIKLDKFLIQLSKLYSWAINHQGKIGDSIRQDRFIDTINKKGILQLSCTSAESPELHRFLNLEFSQREKYIHGWLSLLDGLKTSVDVILRLVRESGINNQVIAPIGDYLIEKPDSGLRLLRIRLPNNLQLFPEISSGKHRIAIHFYSLDNELLKKKFHSEVHFGLSFCGLKEIY